MIIKLDKVEGTLYGPTQICEGGLAQWHKRKPFWLLCSMRSYCWKIKAMLINAIGTLTYFGKITEGSGYVEGPDSLPWVSPSFMKSAYMKCAQAAYVAIKSSGSI